MAFWNLERTRIRSRNVILFNTIPWDFCIQGFEIIKTTLKGLFTLLVEEFGCRGVEVEEVYDLDSFDMHSGEVYGLIFLFKWASDQPGNNRTSSRRTREKDKNIEKNTEIVNYHEGMNLTDIRLYLGMAHTVRVTHMIWVWVSTFY